MANKPRQRRDAVRRMEQLVKRLTTRGGYPTIVGPLASLQTDPGGASSFGATEPLSSDIPR